MPPFPRPAFSYNYQDYRILAGNRGIFDFDGAIFASLRNNPNRLFRKPWEFVRLTG